MKIKRDSKVPIDKEHNHTLEKLDEKNIQTLKLKTKIFHKRKIAREQEKYETCEINLDYFLLISIILGLYILMGDAMNKVDML